MNAHERYTRYLVLALATALAVIAMIGGYTPEDIEARPGVHITTCQEDEPCWDGTTMGNLVCGTTTEGAP